MDRQEIYEILSELWSDWPEASEADKEYWTKPDITAAQIAAKYNLKKWKPEPVGLPIVCPDCGEEDTIVLRNKKDVVSRGEKWKCPNRACPGHEIRMPFGKYKGLTVAEVCRKQPSYLAWFLEMVESDCEEVRVVKAEIEKLPVIKWLLEKYHERQLQWEWAQRSRFSPAAVDDLCDKLFNGG